MATNTYVALDKVTLGSSAASVTFSSISSAYTDLILVISGKYTASTDASPSLRFNNDSSSNYSATGIDGNGSSASSFRLSNQTDAIAGSMSGEQSVSIIQVMNYSNTTTYKTTISRGNNPSNRTRAYVSLWRSTAAINRIDVLTSDPNNFAVGTTFSLYGIQAQGVSPAAKATGGAIYSDDTYYYHVFGSTGTFTPLQSLSADVLVVAGGGGGGRIIGGGGGAGGVLAFTSQSLTATGYTVTVGGGGSGAITSSYTAGTVGGDSQFGALTLVKGGGAGGGFQAIGGNGGSGGGAGGGNTSYSGGTATSGQGYAGGNSPGNSWYSPGGGGGAGGAGQAGQSATKAGDGGVGTSTYSSWGTATGVGQNVSGTYYLAGGGGGGISTAGATASNAGAGGYGGGGRGGYTSPSTDYAGVAGTANTGGGGGAAPNDYTGLNTNTEGKNGGSGVVIVRYAK